MMEGLPDIPYDNVHKFLAAIGFVLILPALFVEPVHLESSDILLAGVAGAVLGLFGWTFESVAIPYLRNITDDDETSWKKKRKIKHIQSLALFVRIIIPGLFIFAIMLAFL